ncbi:5'/3'-nucleotidase SurE [Peptoniphilus indolicus]|uniref:5'-nucleotidase SurE n=2 Tax=Peptoniphilus indolicus TaxID=33030 RepID=G4D1K5_9FIRM|nr:5'/3'-nucleotidase SurE [Peptoniphilus indolicus]EGY80585.1 acid phosphatase SurE [Peptoniphilus indolicus ATCC 29427]SUB74978.1 5'-nucleotidase surE [Peptoniphilus indolicus]
MNILLTNDDGYFAPGIKELARQLIAEGHNITIVAPTQENSGKSHSITLREKLVVSPVTIDGIDAMCYSVSGTPADCVRAALNILDTKFDFCFSGCNFGYNAGMDILYSGTVSAAIEANVFGINSFAVSAEFLKENTNYETAAKVAIEVFNKVHKSLDKVQVVNINVPSVEYSELKGIKAAKIGGNVMDKYTKVQTENGYTLSLSGRNEYNCPENTDRYLLSEGYATVTPLLYNLTDIELLKNISEKL